LVFTAWALAVGGSEEHRPPPWIFIDGTDKVKGGLMVLFFGLVFSFPPSSKNFLPTPLIRSFPA